MKKILIVCLVALAVLPVMADGTVGVTAGPQFSWWTVTGAGSSEASKSSQFDVNVSINAEQFFGDSGFGVAFGVGANVPLRATVPVEGGGTKTINPMSPSDGEVYYLFPIMWNPSLGVVYRLSLSNSFAMKFGVGAAFSYGAFSHTTDYRSIGGHLTRTETTQFSFGAYADVAAAFGFGNFEAKIGARGIYTFKTNLRQVQSVDGSVTSDVTGNKTGFTVLPYVGLSYRY